MSNPIPEYVLAGECAKPSGKNVVVLSLGAIKSAQLKKEMKLCLVRHVQPSILELKNKHSYKSGPMPSRLSREIDSTVDVSGHFCCHSMFDTNLSHHHSISP